MRGLYPPKVIIRNRWERKAQWKLGALREGCGGAGSRDETRGGGPAMLHPALPGGGKWHEGGARRKGSLHDPFSPLTSGPFAVFLYGFFFFFMFLSSCYISKKQNKRQPVFEREWRDLENQAACTSPFAELLGFFAHLAAGARGASPSLAHLEWSPYTSLTAQRSVSGKGSQQRCTATGPLRCLGQRGSRLLAAGWSWS